ncbi:glycoside hydrolase family 125 protein [Vagococcus xieshaowenii]|uniref:Metal-independent alpha-mannosidase n=1 Tax=Vagococcus xieshaowenii TaxID=2562451 RepID=A0A4Z0DCZ9_9ENTE|nr:glycoside hydrolase family 125 protein [Vagococcus xieshaowenii]QCA28453.1 metal-independent alpha-mannosidase [Vagococcus xieshaowenii]TFZ42792.1 metal-independent alpha-mannosidase [Vagococcus xieshaowenii]
MNKELEITLGKLKQKVKTIVKDDKLSQVFNQCIDNTLETTVKITDEGDTFVITGDIPAMWLRDSSAQLKPYLFLAKESSEIRQIITGLIKRQMKCILIDPYANAFNEEDNGHCYHQDETEMTGWIWERKYEVDSLCYPIELAYLLWKETGQTSHFDQAFFNASKLIIETFKVEQHHEHSPYHFERFGERPEDTLTNNGLGEPVGYTGMTWSGFRPSDDSCRYNYLIPANMFAVVVLKYLNEIMLTIYQDAITAEEAACLANEIDLGIQTYGIVTHEGKRVYAYEVDGLGNYVLMDDANVPSLLAAPYLGYCDIDDECYLATRDLILSTDNPYFYQGEFLEGVGSFHTPPNYVWPIALSIQGLTSTNYDEKIRLLDMMANNDGGTNYMHEGVYVDDPSQYTREWFSWANMMYCALLLDTFPEVVS